MTIAWTTKVWATIAAGLVVIAAAVLALSEGASQAQEDPPPPIQAELLTSSGHNAFTDDVAVQLRDKPDGRPAEVVNLRDGSRLAVAEFTIQPGAWFPWHTHPGAGLVAVTQGELVYIYADDCVERRYGDSEGFVDPGLVHTAYNPGESETVVVASFVGVPEGAPLATPVGGEAGAALNERCGTSAPTP